MLTRLKTNKSVAMSLPKDHHRSTSSSTRTSGVLIAETTAEKARDVTLARAPGSYKVKRVLDDRLEVGRSSSRLGTAPMSASCVCGRAAVRGHHHEGRIRAS